MAQTRTPIAEIPHMRRISGLFLRREMAQPYSTQRIATGERKFTLLFSRTGHEWITTTQTAPCDATTFSWVAPNLERDWERGKGEIKELAGGPRWVARQPELMAQFSLR
jgi:hypothetical protein